MNITKQLYQLQEIDLEIESGEQVLKQKMGQLGKRQSLDQAQDRLAAAKEHLEALQHQQHNAEWGMDDLESKIKEVEEQLYGGKITNPKELSSLQHEINTMKAGSDQMETKALEIIDQVEAAEKGFLAAKSEFRHLEDEWRSQQQQLSDEIARLKSRLADLRQKRQQFSAEIEPQAVSLYEKVRQQKKPPVAKVEQGICRVCRITLPASELQRARGGYPIQCGSCGRILFLS